MSSADRYVIAGLARARVAWFGEVGRWSMASALPAEFVRCVSAAEVRARLSGVGVVSALLVDAGATGVDRDLLAEAASHGTAVFVVDDERTARDWVALGAAAVLPSHFDVGGLTSLLTTHATPVAPMHRPSDPLVDEAAVGFSAPLLAVCGVRGAGTSTVAMAVAQGLARRADGVGSVLLADLALDTMLAAYHDSADVVPGVQEVVEAHRGGTLDRTAIRRSTFDVASRGYALLLGLRRPRDWTALPPRSVDAAIDSLRRTFRWVVADVTGELDGEAETGSVDLEERNHLARAAVGAASAVVVVGAADLRGVRQLVRMLDDLDDLGVSPDRMVPIINRSPRSPAARGEIARAVTSLASTTPRLALVHLPERRGLDAVQRAVDPLPAAIVGPVTAAAMAALELAPSEAPPARMPVRVARAGAA